MTQTRVTRPSMDAQLSDADWVLAHEWADDIPDYHQESIKVEVSPAATADELIDLHVIAETHDYVVRFLGTDPNDTAHFRLAATTEDCDGTVHFHRGEK